MEGTIFTQLRIKLVKLAGTKSRRHTILCMEKCGCVHKGEWFFYFAVCSYINHFHVACSHKLTAENKYPHTFESDFILEKQCRLRISEIQYSNEI